MIHCSFHLCFDHFADAAAHFGIFWFCGLKPVANTCQSQLRRSRIQRQVKAMLWELAVFNMLLAQVLELVSRLCPEKRPRHEFSWLCCFGCHFCFATKWMDGPTRTLQQLTNELNSRAWSMARNIQDHDHSSYTATRHRTPTRNIQDTDRSSYTATRHRTPYHITPQSIRRQPTHPHHTSHDKTRHRTTFKRISSYRTYIEHLSIVYRTSIEHRSNIYRTTIGQHLVSRNQ
jgi:hypothetical protein